MNRPSGTGASNRLEAAARPAALPAVGIIALLLMQIGLLTIGITRDYELKHEDNNALHATFARSHLRLGLATTRGQNYFYSPASGSGEFYPNHPPGPGLVLAVVYGLTGHDGPAVTRSTAIFFHVLGTWLFYFFSRRLLRSPLEIGIAMLFYIVLPESAFFGRMVNHEILVLPGAILLVRGYWESVHGDWTRARWIAAIAAGAAWTVFNGWAGFFAIGACGLHAAWELFGRKNPRAWSPFLLFATGGPLVFALTLAPLVWATGGDFGYFRGLLATRSGGPGELHFWPWLGRILELHWRYFGLTSVAALAAVVYRAARRRSGEPLDPAQEVAVIFLISGASYVVAFAFNATLHDYWQFGLLPATALGVALLLRSLVGPFALSFRPWVRNALLGLVILDVTAVTSVTLVRRHVKREGYCLEVVEQIRRNHL